MNNKELISKVDVIEQIISINAKDIQKANKGLDPISVTKQLVSDIQHLPTVESRPKGKWEKVMTDSTGIWLPITQCSVCKDEVVTLQDGGGSEFLSNFCPFCGAEMESE